MGPCELLYLLVAISSAAALFPAATSPPLIVKQSPVEEMLFQVAQPGEVDKPFIIECEAVGEPAPRYRWMKNGQPFEFTAYDNRISQEPGRGTLKVSQPRDVDLGQYQCFAYNEWGTATSNSVFVRKAELNSFNQTGGQRKEQAEEGKPFKLTCIPPDGYPKPKVFWMKQSLEEKLIFIDDSRMTLDPEGNLWFSNVTRDDESTDFGYVCAVKTTFNNDYKVSDKIFLLVNPTGISPALNKREPVRQYVSRKMETALVGKQVRLHCIYGGTPLPQVEWRKNNQSIDSQHISFDNYGKSLIIKKVTYEDQGTYTCFVSNGVGSAQSYSIQLNIEAAPFFIEAPQIQNLAENETAIIRCKAGGIPAPQISWIHNGKPIAQAPRNDRRTVNADSIIIRDLTRKDTGNYGCNATNSVSYVYMDVYINVQSLPPLITTKPDDLVKVDGSTAVLKCRASGAPKPLVRWIRDGMDVTGGKYNITSDGDLVIPDVSFNDDGKYQCLATNKLGNDTAYGSLVVKRHTEITDHPERYEVPAGNPATLRCNAKGDPSLKLEFEWQFKGEPLDLDDQRRFSINNDHSLLIPDTTEHDSGEYTCRVSTKYDEARAQATLIVQDKPNPPELTNVQCERRVAHVSWRDMGDNRAIISHYIIQYNTTFTPDSWAVASDSVPFADKTWSIDLSPWANYTFRVKAVNKIGESAPSGHSKVCTTQPDVPYKNPDGVQGAGSDPTNMIISWARMPQIEHNGPGFNYRVSWRHNITGQQWQEATVTDWQQTELVVPNTLTFQPYRIKVVAGNSKGTSNVAPVEVMGWSGEDIPTEAPTNFTLTKFTMSTTAILSWNHVSPESLRGHFKGYKIQTWIDGEEEILKETFVNADANTKIVDKLKPFSKYNARVMAYNGRYNGPPSDILSFVTPEGTPGTVKSFNAYPIGSSAMLLKWDKPVDENGILTGYKIYYEKVHDGIRQERKQKIDAKSVRALLGGLESNTKYKIEIRATTKAGEGDEYFVIQSTKPSDNTVLDIPVFDYKTLPGREGTAHVLVQWLPSIDGHPGSQFTAWYKLKGRTEWMKTNMVTEDFVVLTGLEPGQIYEVKITTHDGNRFSTSEIKDVDTSIDGPVIKRDEKMATAGWFIGVMVALAFLLLVLVLVCVARRNRGGKYDVHDRELAHGRRDYGDGGFHEYTHPIDSKSRHSMSSGAKPGPESDTDSLAEYGEGETGRFTEDGSFIGQYVPGARVLPPPRDVEPRAPAPPPPTYV